MRGSLLYTKTVRAKGKDYVYFDTGNVDSRGKKVLARLPAKNDPSFGAVYAAHLGHRSRRGAIAAAPAMTVPVLADLYEKSPQFRKLAPATRKLYQIYLTRLADRFHNAPANEVEARDFVLMMDEMAKTPAAANMVIKIAGALYTWGRRRQHVTVDPFQDIEAFEGGEHQPWPEHLVEAALAEGSPRVRLLVGLLYYTAQRIGDVCRLRWSDIRDGRIYMAQQKTGKDMVLPLHRDLGAALERADRCGMTIVTRQDGSRLSTDQARADLQDFAAARGFKIVPHGLRKNAVNALLECGCSAAETAAISGQSLQMVEHYAKRRSTERLGSAAILKWENAK